MAKWINFRNLDIESEYIIKDKDYDNRYMLNYLYHIQNGIDIGFDLNKVLENIIETNKNIALSNKEIENKYKWLRNI